MRPASSLGAVNREAISGSNSDQIFSPYGVIRPYWINKGLQSKQFDTNIPANNFTSWVYFRLAYPPAFMSTLPTQVTRNTITLT